MSNIKKNQPAVLGKPKFKENFSGLKLLSASRIDALNTCSWSYFLKYEEKVPDENNDGARRGTIIHALCECLIENKDRHFKIFKDITENGDVYSVPSVKRFIEVYAKKVGLNIDNQVINKAKTGFITNRSFINEMTLVALKNDFFGAENEISLAEIECGLDIRNRRAKKRFVLQGFVDKMFLRFDEPDIILGIRSGKINVTEVLSKVKGVRIVDYKTSSSKFDAKKIASNTQALVYQMFTKDMIPHLNPSDITMDFLFLQFPKQPLLRAPGIEESEILLYQEYLFFLFEKINNFSKEDAYANFGYDKVDTRMLCGSVGFKTIMVGKTKIETEEPKWICPFQKPFEYFALKNVTTKKIIKTSKKREDLNKMLTKDEMGKLCDGELCIEKLQYEGCPKFQQKSCNEDDFF